MASLQWLDYLADLPCPNGKVRDDCILDGCERLTCSFPDPDCGNVCFPGCVCPRERPIELPNGQCGTIDQCAVGESQVGWVGLGWLGRGWVRLGWWGPLCVQTLRFLTLSSIIFLATCLCIVSSATCLSLCVSCLQSPVCHSVSRVFSHLFVTLCVVSSATCPFDIVLVVDESGSIWKDVGFNNWPIIRDFINDIVVALQIGQQYTRIGMVMFGDV